MAAAGCRRIAATIAPSSVVAGLRITASALSETEAATLAFVMPAVGNRDLIGNEALCRIAVTAYQYRLIACQEAALLAVFRGWGR